MRRESEENVIIMLNDDNEGNSDVDDDDDNDDDDDDDDKRSISSESTCSGEIKKEAFMLQKKNQEQSADFEIWRLFQVDDQNMKDIPNSDAILNVLRACNLNGKYECKKHARMCQSHGFEISFHFESQFSTGFECCAERCEQCTFARHFNGSTGFCAKASE